LILSFTEFEDKRFLTYKQIRKLGGKLRKGSKGIKVFYFKLREDENGEELSPIVRYYTVFNIEQTSYIEYSPKLRE
jgi:antirestriction protein ArdC